MIVAFAVGYGMISPKKKISGTPAYDPLEYTDKEEKLKDKIATSTDDFIMTIDEWKTLVDDLSEKIKAEKNKDDKQFLKDLKEKGAIKTIKDYEKE